MSETQYELVPPEQPRTRLITRPGEEQSLTLRHDTDARSAVTLGLGDYLRTFRSTYGDGREMRFQRVFDDWSAPEDAAVYPSALVHFEERAAYDLARLTPTYFEIGESAEVGGVLQKSAELTTEVTVWIASTDGVERSGLVEMCESAFNPVDWMYGFRLELPHYFGARATFEPGGVMYADVEEDAQERLRLVSIYLNVSLPLLRVVPDGARVRQAPKIRVKYEELPSQC